MGRAPCCDKANVKKGPWSPEEDAKLKDYIDKYGTGGNWIALPQKIGIKRCGKSCRLRWLNYLRPNIKHGGFTEEEDNIICSLYISIGSRWSIIAAQLPGRTDNDIKNYWNTRLKKKLLGRRRQSNTNRASSIIPKDRVIEEENNYNLQNLSNSALERLQLHYMHLQNLQNPLSNFYNNNPSSSLWPKFKLNPLQQKMTQTLNSPNENTLIVSHQDYSPLSNFIKTDEVGNSINGLSSSSSDQSSFALNNNDQINFTTESETTEQNARNDQLIISSGFTQAELDDLLLDYKTCDFYHPAESSTRIADQNDCFREMDIGLKDSNLGWWSNEFDASSASLNSWGLATMLHDQSGEMYQDYAVNGYI